MLTRAATRFARQLTKPAKAVPPVPARAMAAEATATTNSFRLGLCQTLVGADKAANLATAKDAVAEAVGEGAQVVCLPECFNSPYATDQFPVYAEKVNDPASDGTASPLERLELLLTQCRRMCWPSIVYRQRRD